MPVPYPALSPGVFSRLQNPITRTVARIVPALEIASEEEGVQMAAKWHMYCLVAWKEGLRDPDLVTDLREWCDPGGSGVDV